MGKAFKIKLWDVAVEDDGYTYPLWLSRPALQGVRLALNAAAEALDEKQAHTADLLERLESFRAAIKLARQAIDDVTYPIVPGTPGERDTRALIRMKAYDTVRYRKRLRTTLPGKTTAEGDY